MLVEALSQSVFDDLPVDVNRANFTNPNSSIGTSTAGQISGTYPARIMQMALKLAF